MVGCEREEPAAAVYGGEIAHGRSAQLARRRWSLWSARAWRRRVLRSSSARPLGPLACREDDARRRARPRPDARCAAWRSGPRGASMMRPATCYVCVVERDLRIETRWRCLLRRYRDRQYMLHFYLHSLTLTSLARAALSRAAARRLGVSLGLGRPVVSRPGPRPRCVCVPLYALDGLSHVGSPDL